MSRYSLKQRGDTLIEVLFAISVFSLVAVGALAIMNQGSAASQRSLEITLVRQQIDAQAETLRFMHDSYVAVYQSDLVFDTTDTVTSPAEEWSKMLTGIGTGQTTVSGVSDCPAKTPTGSFVLDPLRVRYVKWANKTSKGTDFAQIQHTATGGFSKADGMWIEAVRSVTNTGDSGNQANAGYIDFHILTCWDTAGSSIPSTQGTIVRLYDPRG